MVKLNKQQKKEIEIMVEMAVRGVCNNITDNQLCKKTKNRNLKFIISNTKKLIVDIVERANG
jgi:hypothetical protein